MKKFYDFNTVGDLIPKMLQERHLGEIVEEQRVLRTWERVAPGFLTESTEQTKAIEFKKGRLVIACLSDELARKIIGLVEQITQAINEVLGKKMVFVIHVEY